MIIAVVAKRMLNKRKKTQTKKKKNDDDVDDESDIFKLLNSEVEKEAKAQERQAFAWSAWTICESLAVRKGFRLPGAGGRPDTYKAGLDIVQDCLSGKINFFFEPPPLQKKEAGTQ